MRRTLVSDERESVSSWPAILCFFLGILILIVVIFGIYYIRIHSVGESYQEWNRKNQEAKKQYEGLMQRVLEVGVEYEEKLKELDTLTHQIEYNQLEKERSERAVKANMIFIEKQNDALEALLINLKQQEEIQREQQRDLGEILLADEVEKDGTLVWERSFSEITDTFLKQEEINPVARELSRLLKDGSVPVSAIVIETKIQNQNSDYSELDPYTVHGQFFLRALLEASELLDNNSSLLKVNLPQQALSQNLSGDTVLELRIRVYYSDSLYLHLVEEYLGNSEKTQQ